MDLVLNTIEEYFKASLGYLFDSGKRIHILYLLTSLVLAYYVFKTTRRRGSFLKYIFHKKVWLGKSAKVDYCMFFFNGLIRILLIAPYVYFGFQLTFEVSNFLTEKFGYMERPLSVSQTLILYTIVLTLVSDFFVFLIHYAMHKIPFLWEFHKVHHSATSMNPITQYRIHPVELILNNIQSILLFGVVTGVFDYLSEGNVNKWLFMGVNGFSWIFFIWGASLRHSHVKLRFFNFLEYVFLSPMQHQIHHSKNPEHWNKNMGSRTAIWDWIFGTLYLSKDVEKINFGLGGGLDSQYSSFMQNMANPFVNNYKKIRRKIRKLYKPIISREMV